MSEMPRRLLVVEDEAAQRLMYSKALTRLDFEVTAVESGEDAREKLAASSFAMALLDLNLPGEHGLELFEHVREHYPATSVIIASGYGTFDHAKRAIRMDVVDFLSKPVRIGELEAAVERAWARHVLVQTPVAQLAAPERIDLAAEDEADALVAGCGALRLDNMERALIMEALRRSEDNRKTAAYLLGISERTLYYRLSQYKIRH